MANAVLKRRIVLFIVLCGLLVLMHSIAFGSDEMVENDEPLLELAEKYYSAIMEKDEETLETIVNPWNDTVKEETFDFSKKLNRIDNVKTYSISGPLVDSWLVYPCCEAWFDGMDIGVPTLFNPLLVITTDNKDLVICSDRTEYADFINEANKSDNVQELISDINKQYEEVLSNGKNDAEDGSASLSTYAGILEAYTAKMENALPQLVNEYNQESSGINDINKLAELCNKKVSDLAEICNEGVGKMADLMFSNGDSYDTYNNWAQKLYGNYTDIAQTIQEAYLNSAMK